MSKKSRPPKAKRFSTEQTDQLLNYLKNNNAPEENFSVAKGLIEGNLLICAELERGTLTIAKLRKLFQIQGSENPPRRSQCNRRSLIQDNHHIGCRNNVVGRAWPVTQLALRKSLCAKPKAGPVID